MYTKTNDICYISYFSVLKLGNVFRTLTMFISRQEILTVKPIKSTARIWRICAMTHADSNRLIQMVIIIQRVNKKESKFDAQCSNTKIYYLECCEVILIIIFAIIHSAEKQFLLTKLGKICNDIGKETLGNKDECRQAAKELDGTFKGEWNRRISPKGCFWRYENVYWNKHLSGKGGILSKAICRRSGK